VDEVTGLWPHRGKEVSVFADGFVVASPNNAGCATLTVSALGHLTLPRCYAVVHVGLPVVNDLETLDIDNEQGPTMADKKKLITKAVVMVRDSLAFFAGPSAPTDDDTDPLEGLFERKIRDNELYDAGVLSTGSAEILFDGSYSTGGHVFIRNVDPVPLSIMAISPIGLIPQGGR
jgi:hypothetical protein